MYRFNASVGRLLWLLAAPSAGVAGCGDVAEWAKVPGTLTLRATPLPPEAGQPLTLAIEAQNVGPVRVYQDDTVIGTFANVDLDGRQSFQVTAVSSAVPRAEALGYDFDPIRAEAEPFTTRPGPSGDPMSGGGSGGGSGGDGGVQAPQDDCPGVTDAPGACSAPDGFGSVQLTVVNATSGPVTLYRRDSLPSGCFNQVMALLAPGASRTTQQVSGNVMLMVADATAQALRTVSLPPVSTCRLVVTE